MLAALATAALSFCIAFPEDLYSESALPCIRACQWGRVGAILLARETDEGYEIYAGGLCNAWMSQAQEI